MKIIFDQELPVLTEACELANLTIVPRTCNCKPECPGGQCDDCQKVENLTDPK